MKKYLLIAVIANIWQVTHGQNLNVPYGRLNGSGGYNIHQMSVSDISSDFGMRIVTSGNYFHRGIDYAPVHCDALLSIESGTIVRLNGTGSGAKSVTISGGNGGHIFAYVHIFSDESLPIQIGQFILEQLPTPNSAYYVIIDLVNGRALSDQNNILFTSSNGNQYTTTNQVMQNWPIAPMGTSGGVNKHLHLSLLESGVSYSSPTESIDPWHATNHPNNNLETRIRSRVPQNFTHRNCEANHPLPQSQTLNEWGDVSVNYTDNTRNILEVEVQMPGAIPVANTAAGLDKYTNVVMNESRIDILIGSTGVGLANILGRHNSSKFIVDPIGANETYPKRLRDGGVGGVSDTEGGCIAFAYRSNGDAQFVLSNGDPVHAHDYYIFPDFYLRIHKNHPTGLGAELLLANHPKLARYEEGNHEIVARVTNIDGDT